MGPQTSMEYVSDVLSSIVVEWNSFVITSKVYSLLSKTWKIVSDKGVRVGEECIGTWGLEMQTVMYRIDKQQGPTVQHRELYSVSCDKP